jgi:hypothetical protein
MGFVLELQNAARAARASDQPIVIGLSTTNDDAYKLAAILPVVEREFPKATRVVGGPPFREEVPRTDGFTPPPMAETFLRQHRVHVVNAGGARSFVQWMKDFSTTGIEVDLPGLYRLEPGTGRLLGRSEGKYPEFDPDGPAPYLFSENRDEVETTFGDGCDNGCGFCAAAQGTFEITQDQIVRTFERVFAETNPRYNIPIYIHDSNAFRALRKSRLMHALNQFEPIGPNGLPTNIKHTRLTKAIYLDPGSLVGPDGIWLTDALLAHGTFCFNLGRDRHDEMVAEKIGKKHHGQPKTQAQLDAEKQALLTFVQKLKGWKRQHSWHRIPLTVSLFYIITPFETRESLKGLFQEMKQFAALSTPAVEVATTFFPLTAYPGTELRSRYWEYLVRPDDLAFFSSGNNMWSDRLGPASAFLDYITQPHRDLANLRGTPSFYDRLMDLADDAFDGRIKPTPDEKKQRTFYM